MSFITIAVTDDHPMIRSGIINHLSSHASIKVTAEYSCGSELLAGLAVSQPDILLLDMQLPDMHGTTLAPVITKKYPAVKIIVLSSTDILVQVKKMMQNGCQGYLLKDADIQTITEAIQTVYNGGQFIMPSLQRQLMNDMFGNGKKNSVTLTRREIEVLKLIANELTTQEIANQLFLSAFTVEKHRLNIIHKMKVKNTAGLVKKAVEQGLI